MKLFHENPIFETVKSKVIISLFETVRLSVSISPRNLYNSLKSIKKTVLCLNIGTPINNKSPFVPNGKLIIFRYPKIMPHYNLVIMLLNIGTPKNH